MSDVAPAHTLPPVVKETEVLCNHSNPGYHSYHRTGC